MSRTIECSLRMIGFAAILAAPVAWAQEAPPVRVRGTIEGIIDSAVYVVKTRDGAELKVTLPEKPQIAGIVKASLSDIKEGSFVGVTAMPKPDGSLSALEVHIFPEAMRGTGEGHRWAHVDFEIQGRGEENLRPGGCTHRRLRPGRHERSQAWRKSPHHRGQAA